MECREPLVTKIEVPSTTAVSPANETIKENVATPSRYSYTRRGYQGRDQYDPRGKQQPPQKKTYITQRLPLPKNAVLLSLIQASEPARRRHAEETVPNDSNLPPVLPSSPSEDESKSKSTETSPKESFVKFHKPSPLFVDNSSSSPVSVQEHHMGSMLEHDDEEHKIRVGTYLEGGPCGTYAVAAKAGLLVYPTLFEHSLKDDEDLSRDVENMVKNSYRNKFFAARQKKGEKQRGGCGLPRSASCAAPSGVVGGMQQQQLQRGKDKTAEITLGTMCDGDECSEENVAVEAQFTSETELDDGREDETDEEESLRGEALSDPGGGLRTRPNMLSISTLSKRGELGRSKDGNSSKPLTPPGSIDPTLDTSTDPALSATLKLRRQFSLGSGNPAPGAGDPDFDRSLIRLNYGDRVQVVSMDSRGWVKLARGYGYIRLENDKQLVKGAFICVWSSLSYFSCICTYIRSAVAQYTSVGGTSDKACQIEAMLHELSLERNRLKHEQKKLEHLSAGLMIDLQCSLLTSDDTVIVHAPEGLAPVPNRMDRQSSTASKDDLEINTHSRKGGRSPVRPPPVSKAVSIETKQPHEIRTAKSHSPGRNYSTYTPPSPPYNPTTPGGSSVNSYAMTPTRVNFRTGLSGHRALSSSHSHPHDFIQPIGPSRSMSNHAGLGSKKSSKLTGRSIY